MGTWPSFKVVEKSNVHAVYAVCVTRESAERWIEGFDVKFYVDKSLTRDSFTVVES